MSEVLDPPLIHPATAALDRLAGAVDDLAAAELFGLDNVQLLELTARLQQLRSRSDAAAHRLVREVDARGAAVEAGAPSTAAWLRARLHLHPGAAKRMVATARALHHHGAGPLVPAMLDDDGAPASDSLRPRLCAVFDSGHVSAEHVTVACEVLDALPRTLAEATVHDAEAYLAEQAQQHDPLALARLGRHLRHVLDAQHGDTLADDEEQQVATRTFEIVRLRDGSSDIKGHLDPELTATLLSQLSPLAAPRPAADGGRDARSVGKRNADALADLLDIAASSGKVPVHHGTRPSIAVTMSLETLQRRLGAAAATLDWSGPISAEAARRLACDARIIPIVLGAQGEPLDVGRTSYPVTIAIWRALVARDKGCAFAGCDRPPEWTEAHHRVHWADGGETSVENCCLLCDHHHRSVHHHGWEVRLVDGQILTIPPPWVDPQQTPRRHTGRDPLAARATLTPSDQPPLGD